MSADIEVIHKWGADACLAQAAQQIPNHEKVIVLSYENGKPKFWSANMTHAEALWLMENIKRSLLNGWV